MFVIFLSLLYKTIKSFLDRFKVCIQIKCSEINVVAIPTFDLSVAADDSDGWLTQYESAINCISLLNNRRGVVYDAHTINAYAEKITSKGLDTAVCGMNAGMETLMNISAGSAKKTVPCTTAFSVMKNTRLLYPV